jgi:hypothetical protein
MKSVTLHNIDPLLYDNVKKIAQNNDTSLNKTIKKLLKESLGLTAETKHADFSYFSNKWVQIDGKEFEKTQEMFQAINQSDWK